MAALIEALAIETGIGIFDIRRIATRAPLAYKVYEIPKRTGGTRVIAQPAREVKSLQRAIVEILLKNLPVHSAATAYREGLSILDNANRHVANGPLLKLDLKEFFPSLRSRDWERYCRERRCLETDDDIALSSQLLFRYDYAKRSLRLAIGAPSSPMLSNILMFEFDTLISDTVSKDMVTYTRYADDMTFSAPATGYLIGVKSATSSIIRRLGSPNLCINDKKTVYVTKKYQRTVTGLTLANDGRVTIGRERKRTISATVNRARKGMLDQSECQVLAGTLAYVNAVEPAFVTVLERKYGQNIIANIKRYIRLGVKPAPHKPPVAQLDRFKSPSN